MIPWTSGRGGTGYFKWLITSSERFLFDIWLLKYPEGSRIRRHTDPARAGYRHYRLNIVLWKAVEGGGFYAWHKEIWHWPYDRIIFFRPDISPHIVNRVVKGTRYVLSIGWLWKESK